MNATRYAEFISTKRKIHYGNGIEVELNEIHDKLFPFQKSIVQWALKKGRAGIFAATGMGKTLMQIEWARNVQEETGGNVLILAPIAVSDQTIRESANIGVDIGLAHEETDSPIVISNYQKIHKLDRSKFVGIVLDESSILKSFNGKTRQQITEFANRYKFRLCCTATPAPNDTQELINHAEFLGVMTGKEALALFFRQDGNTTQKWRIKRHAESDFWSWLASWAAAVRKPSDIGDFDDSSFSLPPLSVKSITTDAVESPSDDLFSKTAITLQDQRRVRRESIHERCNKATSLASWNEDQRLIWCDLNDESQ